MTAGQGMTRKPSNAFITARKGFCYLTIKSFGRNHEMMRVRAYKIDADEKRHMRRLYPEVAFDWKKITQQLAEKREDCRRYRSRRRNPDTANHARGREPFYSVYELYSVYEPGTRTLYTNGMPSSAAGMGALLDAVLQIDRGLTQDPSAPESAPTDTEPSLGPVKNSGQRKPLT